MSRADDELDAAVLSQLAIRLADRSSDVVATGSIEESFVVQVRSILAEARQLVLAKASQASPVSIEYVTDHELAATGKLAADHNQHPAEALMAAEVFFDEAIRPFIEWANASTVDSILHATRALHHAIWRRFPPGAIAYTETLRQKLSTAHLDSRLRLSRDLHDRIAQSIAAGIQQIELVSLGAADTDQVATVTGLRDAAQTFRNALMEIQDMTVDLRTRIGELALSQVVRTYLDDTFETGPSGQFTESGEEFPVSSLTSEEILAIVLEALHNARRHAWGATGVLVHFDWQADVVTIEISDDGAGFNQVATRDGALGILVMKERAESIGAGFEISTELGLGTRVTVILPRAAAFIW